LKIQENQLLSKYCTFGIGGQARYFAEIRSIDEACQAYQWAREKKLPVLVIGKGSNCLFRDEPFLGLALVNKIDFCEYDKKEVFVGAGFSFSLLGVQSARKGLTGLEFASGIPASVGGAVFMNAGANGKETYDSLKSVKFLHETGEMIEYPKEALLYSYRTSSFQSMKGCILSARFTLQSKEEARESQLKIIQYRLKTQPYKDQSAGCIFRNPSPEVTAGALIDQCGLKGFSIGGAMVSNIHANFLINTGNATTDEMVELIHEIKRRVKEKTNIDLESEVRILP
jgi:UDP-N-acetylmuramate dehydrogenase